MLYFVKLLDDFK